MQIQVEQNIGTANLRRAKFDRCDIAKIWQGTPSQILDKNMVVVVVLKLHAKNIIITLEIINKPVEHHSITILLKIQLG